MSVNSSLSGVYIPQPALSVCNLKYVHVKIKYSHQSRTYTVFQTGRFSSPQLSLRNAASRPPLVGLSTSLTTERAPGVHSLSEFFQQTITTPRMPRKNKFKSLFCFSSPKDVGGWDFRDPTPVEFRDSISTIRPTRNATARLKQRARVPTAPIFGASTGSDDDPGVAYGAMSVGSPGLFAGSTPRPSISRPSRPATANPVDRQHQSPLSRDEVKKPNLPSSETTRPGGHAPRRAPPVIPVEEYKREHSDHYAEAVPEALWPRVEKNIATPIAHKDYAQHPGVSSLRKKPSSRVEPPSPYSKQYQPPPTPMPTYAFEHGEDSATPNAVRISRSMPALKQPSTESPASGRQQRGMHFSMRSRAAPTHTSRQEIPFTNKSATLQGRRAGTLGAIDLAISKGTYGDNINTYGAK